MITFQIFFDIVTHLAFYQLLSTVNSSFTVPGAFLMMWMEAVMPLASQQSVSSSSNKKLKLKKHTS
jgi:hypothetical protein